MEVVDGTHCQRDQIQKYPWMSSSCSVQLKLVIEKELGSNLASKLTTFIDLSGEYHTKVSFLLQRVVTDSPNPLKKYLLDTDVIWLVKHSYSDSSIKGVIEDSDILECFLGQLRWANKRCRM